MRLGIFSFLSILWNRLMNKLRFPFLCSNYKTFSHLNLKLKQRLFVVDGRFENRGISLGCYSWILPSLPAAGGY